MTKFSEETLTNWTSPPSDTEETKLSNAESMVKDAIRNSALLSDKSIEVFGQGSYANNTNVRLNSDIDINICYTGGFYFDLPPNMSQQDFGLGNPSTYSLEQFKDDVYSVLINKFDNDTVVRKNKCITVLGNSYRTETDVVPTWAYHRYSENGEYIEGTKLRADTGKDVINYPKQHIENGKQKNSVTYRRFKRLTRITKKIRYKMIEDGISVNDSITSFLLESLIWNVPNRIFIDNNSWQERLRRAIIYLYKHTEKKEMCEEWGEVSELLYLFRGNRKWSVPDVNSFLVLARNYLEY